MTKTANCCLGIDLGASSGRVMAGFYDGQTLELREVHRFPNEPVLKNSTLSWNFEELLREVKVGLRKGVAAAAKDGCSIQSIGADSWGVDFGLLDGEGQLITPPVHYRDERTNGIMEEVFASEAGKDEIFSESGIQFLSFNTIYQLAALRRKYPEQLAKAKHLLMIADLVHYLLTGVIACEFTNATTTQLYNPLLGGWSKQLTGKLGLPLAIFPPIIKPGTSVGKLSANVATELEVEEIEIIAVATHDTGSAVAAVPALGNDFAFLSCGTWSLLGTEVNEPVITERSRALNFTNEGGVFGTYRLLKNIMGLWLLQESRAQWQREGKNYSWEQISAMALTEEPFRSLVDPDDPRFLSVGDMPARIRNSCRESGQRVPETDQAVVRCVLESLSLKCRYVLDLLEQIRGVRLAPIHMVGGGIQNELLCQWTANACQREVVAGPIEATVLGNIGMQLVAKGHIADLSEMRAVIRRSFKPHAYKARDSEAWSLAYDRFRELIEK